MINQLRYYYYLFYRPKIFFPKKSYSLLGEDTFLKKYFSKQKKGFYIDVGCYHPIHRNNTYLLHNNGWSGINIDIHQFSIDLFNYLRPDDINLNCAVSDTNGVTKMFYQKALSQLSTIDEFQAKIAFQGNIKKSKIKSLTLDTILEKTKLTDKKIDLLDIDVEGADLRVLKGFTIEKFKPELICVEIHEKEIKNSEIYKYLSNFSYELVWSGVFSHIFKSKS